MQPGALQPVPSRRGAALPTHTYAALLRAEQVLLLSTGISEDDGDDFEYEQKKLLPLTGRGFAGGVAAGYRAKEDEETNAGPVTGAEAQALASLVLGAAAPRVYKMAGGYDCGHRKTYLFMGTGGSEAGPSDPEVLVDEGCATVAGPRFQQASGRCPAPHCCRCSPAPPRFFSCLAG